MKDIKPRTLNLTYASVFTALLFTSHSTYAINPSELNNQASWLWSDYTNADVDDDSVTTNHTDNFNSDGSPVAEAMTNINDNLDQDLLQNFYSLVPEGQQVSQSLLDNTFNNITVKAKTDETFNENDTVTVKVAFLNEGAGYKNSLGYFIYDQTILNKLGQTPSQEVIDDVIKNDIEHVLIFPNSSKTYSGGSLDQGDQVDLGITLSAGQSIGFFINSNGWNGSHGDQKGSFLYGQPFYTLPQLNPSAGLGNKYHVVFNDESSQIDESGFFAYGFEDIKTTYGDKDYNDLIFNVEVTPITAIANIDQAIKIQSISAITQNQGIFAFEDNWPMTGDYDFNDAVIDYKVTKTFIEEETIDGTKTFITEEETIDGTKTTSEFLKNIEINYDIKAIGATFHNGLAMSLGEITDLTGLERVLTEDDIESISLIKTGPRPATINGNDNHTVTWKTSTNTLRYHYPLYHFDDNDRLHITLSEDLFEELSDGYDSEGLIHEQTGCYYKTKAATTSCPANMTANHLTLTINFHDKRVAKVSESAPFNHFLFGSEKGGPDINNKDADYSTYAFPRNNENWFKTWEDHHTQTPLTGPGKRLEIHHKDQATSTFFESSFAEVRDGYNIKAQDSDPFISRQQNLPWMLILPNNWKHTYEGKDMNWAYPDFAKWLANPSTNTNWHKTNIQTDFLYQP